MTYKDKGWGTDYIDNQRRAELLFQKLLTDHPQSDKISDAAYQLGDLYESKAYRQYDRAAALLRALFPVEPQDAVRRPPTGGPPLRAQQRRTQPRHRHLPRHRQP